MKRDSEKKKRELPLSQRYKDIIARNPQLLANTKAGYWYPAPDELRNFYEKNKRFSIIQIWMMTEF
jgi:hypothetical protein